MSDKEVDQPFVELVQRGDKYVFDFLVLKCQRKLGRLISRFVKDSAAVEGIAQVGSLSIKGGVSLHNKVLCKHLHTVVGEASPQTIMRVLNSISQKGM